MNRTSLWPLAGIAAPLVYLVAVVVGGALTPGYSHIAGPVGALIMAGEPVALVLIPLFALYNALLVAFAMTFRDAFREAGVRIGLLAPVALAVTGLLGALMLVYPMDPLGLPLTETGRLNAFFAGIAAAATMAAVFFTAIALRRALGWQALAWYSYASLAVIVLAGIWSAAAGTSSPLMGLAERLMVGAFLQWVLVVAVALLWRPGRSTSS